MIQSHTSTLSDRSRYVGLLTELSAAKLSYAELNLAERLGNLLGFSGSITLASALRQLPGSVSSPSLESAKNIQADVLAVRGKNLRAITDSFTENTGDAQLKVPSNCVGTRESVLQTHEPYRRFYLAHQVEMASSIESLRIRVRVGMSGFSASLAQLAQLDSLFEQSFEAESRTLFGITVKLLEQRFKQLLQEHQQGANSSESSLEDWTQEGQWLDLYYQDMRELLLAEFDVRLQPVLGLLEALNEQVDIAL